MVVDSKFSVAMLGENPTLAKCKALAFAAVAFAMNIFVRAGVRGSIGVRDRSHLMGNRAAASATRAVDLVVSLVVGALVAAYLIPIAIDEILGVDTSSWTNGAGALWDILPVIIVLSIFLYFVATALTKSNM